MTKLVVAVLRGGPSHEYDVSLKTGQHVLSLLSLLSEKYEPKDIFLSRSGEWHRDGLTLSPQDALLGVDVVWNGLHGSLGVEEVERELKALGIPFSGSYAAPIRFAQDKEKMKQILFEQGFNVPKHELIESKPTRDQLIYIFHNYVYPVVVKPAESGSSVGLRVVKTFHELEEAIKHALKYSKKVLVEEFIRGKEAVCGVIEDARGEKLYALMPLEVREGESLVRHSFGSAKAKKLEELARQAHSALELEHYSSSDFIITPRGKIYILETNTFPSLASGGHFIKSLHSVGWHPKHFLDHVLGLALDR